MMASRKKSGSDKVLPPSVDKLDFRPVALLFGDDEFPLATNARALVDRWCPPEEQALGLEILDGIEVSKVDDASALLDRGREGLQTVGLFGGKKVVWLRDLFFLGETKVLQSEAVRQSLDALVRLLREGLPDEVHLVVSMGMLDKRSGFYRACKELGHVLEYSLPVKSYQVEAQAQEKVVVLLRNRGIEANEIWVERFVAKVGQESRMLTQEVEKLSVYLGDRAAVTEDDLHQVVSPGKEASSWDLEDALGRRNLTRSLAILRQLLFQGENGVGLVIRIGNRFRDLLVFREFLHRGWCRIEGREPFLQLDWKEGDDIDSACAGLMNDPRKMNPYRGGRLAYQAKLYSRKELMATHQDIVETHHRMVTTLLPQSLVLEFLVLRILMKDQTPIGPSKERDN